MFIRFRVDMVNISSLLLFLPLLLRGHFLRGSVSPSLLFLIYNLNSLVPLVLPVYGRGALTSKSEIGIRYISIVDIDRGILLILYVLRCLIRLDWRRALLVRT